MIGVRHEWGRLREAIVVDELADPLQREGVVIHRAEIAPRDPLIAIGDGVIAASLRRVARRAERLSLERFATEAMPQGSDSEADGPYLEGGDVLLAGRDVYVGMSGRASDLAGADWLGARFGPEYKVLAIPMRSDVEHLEDVLALVRPGLLICCREQLVDGLPSALRDWDMIAISKEESAQRAAHILSLDENRLIVAARNARVMAQLTARGVNVQSLQTSVALRAAHQPLLRESVVE